CLCLSLVLSRTLSKELGGKQTGDGRWWLRRSWVLLTQTNGMSLYCLLFQTQTLTHTLTHTPIHKLDDTHTHTHHNTQPHTHTPTHTHTHTHTHTCLLSQGLTLALSSLAQRELIW